VDLGESYGSPAGRAVCSAFYDTLMARYGLNSKMLLVPQSRGGLMLYNWAADSGNSAKVSRIAGIYPVGDLRSYPGLATAAPAYGMTALELEQHLTENNPIDRLQPLRDAGVKIMHIHGDNDAVVPLSQNSQVIHDRYIGMGGEMTLIVVPGQGHAEIPEFFQSQQMLDFMLAETSATALTFSFDPPHRAVASLDAFFPNPMNTEATVAFSLPAPSVVDLLVLDVSGRAVARLLSGQTAAGSHTVHWNASTLPSGAYFCTLRADGLVKTEKFFLQR
jgi:hypothetical protein